MLWAKRGPVGDHFSESQLHPNFYMERNTSWYLRGPHEPEFFNSFNELLEFIFISPQPRKFIAFSPGACYLVTKSEIQNSSKEVYRFLSYLSSYKFFPPEAYAVERILWTVFSSTEEINPRFASKAWMDDLMKAKVKKGPRKARASASSLLSNRGFCLPNSSETLKELLEFRQTCFVVEQPTSPV